MGDTTTLWMAVVTFDETSWGDNNIAVVVGGVKLDLRVAAGVIAALVPLFLDDGAAFFRRPGVPPPAVDDVGAEDESFFFFVFLFCTSYSLCRLLHDTG